MVCAVYKTGRVGCKNLWFDYDDDDDDDDDSLQEGGKRTRPSGDKENQCLGVVDGQTRVEPECAAAASRRVLWAIELWTMTSCDSSDSGGALARRDDSAVAACADALPGRSWRAAGGFLSRSEAARNQDARWTTQFHIHRCGKGRSVSQRFLSRRHGWPLLIPPRARQPVSLSAVGLPTFGVRPATKPSNHWLPPLQCNPSAVVEVGGAAMAQSRPRLREGAGADPCSRSRPPLACSFPAWHFASWRQLRLLICDAHNLSVLLHRTTPQTRGCQNIPAGTASSNRACSDSGSGSHGHDAPLGRHRRTVTERSQLCSSYLITPHTPLGRATSHEPRSGTAQRCFTCTLTTGATSALRGLARGRRRTLGSSGPFCCVGQSSHPMCSTTTRSSYSDADARGRPTAFDALLSAISNAA